MHNDKSFKMWKSKKGFNDTYLIFLFLIIKVFLGIVLFYVAKDFNLENNHFADTTGMNTIDTSVSDDISFNSVKFVFSVLLWNFDVNIYLNLFLWIITATILFIVYRAFRGYD